MSEFFSFAIREIAKPYVRYDKYDACPVCAANVGEPCVDRRYTLNQPISELRRTSSFFKKVPHTGRHRITKEST